MTSSIASDLFYPKRLCSIASDLLYYILLLDVLWLRAPCYFQKVEKTWVLAFELPHVIFKMAK